MKTIAMETLRQWLEAGRPVTILDVRQEDKRRESFIPESVHFDAYQALKSNDPTALDGVRLPEGIPVVTVCGMGQASRVAACLLEAKGIEALSLEGGMRAWGFAWNIAKVRVPGTKTKILQVRRSIKGCLSYVVGSAAETVVIDPSVDPGVYLDICRNRGWSIRYVVETHIHADHVSRGIALASQANAELLLPENGRAMFPFRAVHNGEAIEFGQATITALHTPGHTAESMSYILDGAAVFTGDTLFLRGVGRPDLHNDRDQTVTAASRLYQSIHQLLRLAPQTLLLPGHSTGPVPFDQTPIAAELSEVLANIPLLSGSEGEFVRTLVGQLPPTPLNFERISRLNELGEMPEIELFDLEGGANRCSIS